jgi:hypothetical protein
MAPIAAPVESADQSYLRRIDMRIRTLSSDSPGSSELARMEAAREDVLSRISPEELAAYEKTVNVTKTRDQLAAEAEAERIAMEANRDKPSI